jgi:hypothetical protein
MLRGTLALLHDAESLSRASQSRQANYGLFKKAGTARQAEELSKAPAVTLFWLDSEMRELGVIVRSFRSPFQGQV